MPAVLQTDSEYQRNFHWNPSRKSRSYSPPLEVLKPAAGVRSEIAAKASEPSITVKKRPDTSKPTRTTKFEPDADDYMLLGNNDKFAANIKYRSKSRDRALNIKKSRKPDGDEEVATPEAPREPYPAPKVIYDTGAPRQKAKTAAVPPKVTKSMQVQNGRHMPEKPILKAPPEPKDRTRDVRPMKSQSEPVIRESRQKQKQRQQPVVQHQHTKPTKSQAKPVDRREKRKGQLNEFAQTDLARGVADSGQEVPADYAMKYQKGIAPPRSKGPKRLSEYEMQFKWRKGVPSSPLLDAEQLVYKNNPQAPPFRQNAMAKTSEYQSQYQAWQMMKSTPNLRQALEQEERRGASKKAVKHKRSRSLEDLTPDQRPAAGLEGDVSAEDKRLLKESLNPQRLHFPHGKSKPPPPSTISPPKYTPFPRARKEHLRTLLYHHDLVHQRVRSEYSSNFAAPQKFEYEMGAWMGADPPQIVNRPDTDSLISQDGQAHSKAWFSEVVELRKKADEYKKRAQGTHFSREHLAQLYARQAEFWDTASTTEGSIVSALSLETTRSSQASSLKGKNRRDNKVGRSLQLDIDQLSSPHMGTVTPLSERTLTPDLQEDELGDFDDDVTSFTGSARSVDLTPGRVPTPQLRGKTYIKTRHHLDRTTPSVGGAILTSPPHIRSKDKSQHSRPVIRPGKAPSVEAWVETPGNVRESFSAPGHLQLNSTKSPAFGKPTHDSHVLVDEETASDHTLRLDYVKSGPEMVRAKQDLATRLSTIKEASGEYRSTGNSSGIGPAVTLGNLRQSSSVPARVQPHKAKTHQEKPAVTKETRAVQSVKRSPDNHLLEDARAALDIINRADIVELKSLANPPQCVKVIMEAVCILLGVKPEKMHDPTNPEKKIVDYWPPARRLLGNLAAFITDLKQYDIHNIPDSAISKIRNEYCCHPDFNPEKVKSVSTASVSLCKWVLAVEQYDRLLKGRNGVTRTVGQPHKHQAPPSEQKGNLAEVMNKTVGEVEQLRAMVRDLQLVVNDQAAVVQNLKQDKNIAYALPALQSAVEALNCLKKSDISEIKSLSKPPMLVKFVMEAVCILLGVKPVKVPDENNPGQHVWDYWNSTKKMLADSQFLPRLMNYDKDNIPYDMITKIRSEYCNHPEYTLDKMASVSQATVSIFKWVRAVEMYDRVAKTVGPKMKNLRHAEQILAVRKEKLNTKRAQLKSMEEKLNSLKRQYTKETGHRATEHQTPSYSKQKQDCRVQADYYSDNSLELDFENMEVDRDDIPKLPVDDDAMSLSAQSIASSCSLASEVLERAKNRRDVFWQ